MSDKQKNDSEKRRIRKSVNPVRVNPVIRRISSNEKPSSSPDDPINKQVAAIKKIAGHENENRETAEKSHALADRLQNALSENKNLESALASARQETSRFRDAVAAAKQSEARAQETALYNAQLKESAEKQVRELQAEMKKMEQTLSEKERERDSRNAIRIKADVINSLLTDFSSDIAGSLPDLILKDIELRLKVMPGQERSEKLFLLPAVSGSDTDKDQLSELVVRVIPSI